MKTNIETTVVDKLTSAAGNLSNRRQALGKLGLGALALGAFGTLTARANGNDHHDDHGHGGGNKGPSDIDILNFALNLEYLEAEFYTYATTGAGIEAQGVGVTGQGTAGATIIKANPKVPFVTPAIMQYANEIAGDELDHVRLLRAALGNKAVARPKIDLRDSFTAAARAAGLISSSQTFDPFADETSFLLAAFIFEDVGVTAYRGAAPLVDDPDILSAAAGLLGTEAYHAATVRALLYASGPTGQNAVKKISDLRDSLDGSTDDDQGVLLNNVANIVPTDENGLVFARSVAQVLAIVYFSPTATKGGFFPDGINAGSSNNNSNCGPRH